MLVYGVLIVLCSRSWFLVWIGMELNIVSYISLVGRDGRLVCGSVFRYFLVQVVGSMFLLFFVIVGLVSDENINYEFFIFGNVITLIIIIKLGGGIFYFWVPSVYGGLDWFSLFILMRLQKIAPLWVLILLSFNYWMLIIMGFISVVVGGLLGINQMLIRIIMAYSSISHIGWIVIIVGISEVVMVIYYLCYVILVVGVIFFIEKWRLVHIGQLYLLGGGVNFVLVLFFIVVLSLGGFPPFFGFFPKWIGILVLANGGLIVRLIFIIIVGLMGLYYYLRLVILGVIGCLGGEILLMRNLIFGNLYGIIFIIRVGFLPYAVFFY